MSICFHGATAPSGPGPPHCWGFTITLRHTTVGRTPMDKWSARSRALYLTIHNTHNRQISTPQAWLEPAIPASERPKTHALDSAATGIGFSYVRNSIKYWLKMADTLSKETWVSHSTGINKHVHNCSEKSRLTKVHHLLKEVNINVSTQDARRSQWPHGLRCNSEAARRLRLWVRIPPAAWICCECCVLSSRGLCDELVIRPEKSYRLCCVVVCDLETSLTL